MKLLLPPREGVRSSWTFTGKKHEGETIEQVAERDPGYISWAWRQLDLTDDAFYALDDVARQHQIDTDRALKRDNQKFRKLRVTKSVTRKHTKR